MEVNYKDDLSDVILTDEEKETLLKKALESKKAKIREARYWEKVRRDPQPKKYTSDEYWTLFQVNAKVREPNFVIDKYNQWIIDALCYYFAQDPEFEKIKTGFSLRKGIMVYGPYGCGKSLMMEAFKVNQNMSYQCKSVLKIDSMYSIHGDKIILEHSGYSDLPLEATSLFMQKFGGFCFDDMGQEAEEKAHYSNKVNVMSEILKRRYYSDIPFNYTHVTTNSDSEDMAIKYPFLKNSGRFKEMFNFIKFNPKAPNRRT